MIKLTPDNLRIFSSYLFTLTGLMTFARTTSSLFEQPSSTILSTTFLWGLISMLICVFFINLFLRNDKINLLTWFLIWCLILLSLIVSPLRSSYSLNQLGVSTFDLNFPKSKLLFGLPDNILYHHKIVLGSLICFGLYYFFTQNANSITFVAQLGQDLIFNSFTNLKNACFGYVSSFHLPTFSNPFKSKDPPKGSSSSGDPVSSSNPPKSNVSPPVNTEGGYMGYPFEPKEQGFIGNEEQGSTSGNPGTSNQPNVNSLAEGSTTVIFDSVPPAVKVSRRSLADLLTTATHEKGKGLGDIGSLLFQYQSMSDDDIDLLKTGLKDSYNFRFSHVKILEDAISRKHEQFLEIGTSSPSTMGFKQFFLLRDMIRLDRESQVAKEMVVNCDHDIFILEQIIDKADLKTAPTQSFFNNLTDGSTGETFDYAVS